MTLRISVFVGLVLGFVPAMALAGERPVVVELFTSQGCSSCPPANAFLNEISRGRSDVLPLAFHVTYWDRLGWKDPFSLEAATMRQDYYGHRFGDGSYTPEMVVDGMVGLVGSHRDEVNEAIERAKRGQHTTTDINVDKAGENVTIRIGSGVGRGRVLLIGFDYEQDSRLPDHPVAIAKAKQQPRWYQSLFRPPIPQRSGLEPSRARPSSHTPIII